MSRLEIFVHEIYFFCNTFPCFSRAGFGGIFWESRRTVVIGVFGVGKRNVVGGVRVVFSSTGSDRRYEI